MITLYCQRCRTRRVFQGLLTASVAKCYTCDRLSRWITASSIQESDTPLVKWEITAKDVRRLRAIWIDPEKLLQV